MIKLAHVCIETTDLGATEAFYSAIGLTRRFDFNNRQGDLVAFYLAFDDNTFIEVIRNNTPKPDGIVRHFCIEVDDLDAMHARLKKAGIEVSEKKLGIDNTLMISCHDPNGIFIELQQYTDASLQLAGGVCEVDYTP
ncbi:MAG TPA: VOC family protein [Woeseiaceae bacterium]|nr:VOC family protein [Woeseiaceae bacterium]